MEKDDLISRAAALDAISTEGGCGMCARRVLDIPAVDAAPVVMAGAELTDAELIEEIRKAPIVLKPNVDAAPVVRCAYCKHCFDIGSDPMEPYDGESEWYCERFDRDTSAYEIDPYRFFCADGEWRCERDE